ncbi:MAG: hypothetical protein K2Q09_06705, partial [Phycisphaerales bacterium]|nr:hypothetical protein [Phycisphaerales bacterium]
MLTMIAPLAALLALNPPPARVVVLDRTLTGVTGELVSLSAAVANVRTGDKSVEVAHPAAVVAADLWTPERRWPAGGFEGPGADGEPGSAPKGVQVGLTDGSVLRGALLAG